MPRISKTAEQRQDEIIVANIRYYMSRNCINNKQLAEKLGISPKTLWSKMTHDTDAITIAQLRRLANIFNVSWESLIAERTVKIEAMI